MIRNITLSEFAVIDSSGKRMGFTTFATIIEAREYADWATGERLDVMWAEALKEEIEVRRTGNYNNWYRHSLRGAIKDLPVRIIRRKVSKWEEVAYP